MMSPSETLEFIHYITFIFLRQNITLSESIFAFFFIVVKEPSTPEASIIGLY